MKNNQQIAIVGIGSIFPGASDLQQFWDNILKAKDCSREPPAGRWTLSIDDAYKPGNPVPDKVYSRRACFVEDFSLDTNGLDIDEELIASLDPMFHLLLHAGNEAWLDGSSNDLNKNRVGIIVGNIALPTDASSVLTDELLGSVLETQILGKTSDPTSTNMLNRYVAGLPAGLLAKALGLGGGTYTLDAACASSLYALKYAVDELIAGRTDAMLAGGLSRPNSLYTQMGFSALHAISSSGRCSPFDHKGDGLVVGEGSGMFLLKRSEDALRNEDHIYATIEGFGLSNDIGGNLMSPDSEGQLRAMRAAYEQAGWQPSEIDLIECHGTGTPIGDAVEFNSLKSLWGNNKNDRDCVIGSVKSNIGHLLTAAGSAAMLKVLLAMKHGKLPPTANFESAGKNIDLDNSPFTVLGSAKDWGRRDPHTPRRAAISAFGFGGINAHVLLQEWQEIPKQQQQVSANVSNKTETADIAIVGMDACFGPWQSLADFQRRIFGGDEDVFPKPLNRWWGAKNKNNIKGFTIDRVDISTGRFRIPPTELRDMLPQQLLMLQVAANAIDDAGMKSVDHFLHSGVYIGIGLDLNTNNFHFRWSLLNKARQWAKNLGTDLSVEQFAEWLEQLRDACGPPLNANRTMGALGGIVASRIARAFNIGGPSFTLSSEESSGLRALEAGVRALQRKEIDSAIVGAVDLASDIRSVLGQASSRPYSVKGECRPFDQSADGSIVGAGAGAIILKRYEDTMRGGDRIYSIIKGVAAASGGETSSVIPSVDTYCKAVDCCIADAGIKPDSISYIEAHGSGDRLEDVMEAEAISTIYKNGHEIPGGLGSVKADIGHSGAASGIASIIKTSLCLYNKVIPPLRGLDKLDLKLDNKRDSLFAPNATQYWLNNRADGPRRALVNAFSIDGNCISVVLEGLDQTSEASNIPTTADLPLCLFSVEGNDKSDLLKSLQALHALHVESDNIKSLARNWWARNKVIDNKLAANLIVKDGQQLDGLISKAKYYVENNTTLNNDNLFYTPEPLGPEAEIAFVFPGSGNHFHGMGREAAYYWPQVLKQLEQENDYLADQFADGKFWSGDEQAELSHKDVIFGQVWLGAMMSDVVSSYGIKPSAVIGYSLGETAGLFASRTWADRDMMLHRIKNSTLFTQELAGSCNSVRQSWGLKTEDTKVDWLIGIVSYPAKTVKKKLVGREHVYLLIINTESECVIGGNSDMVQQLVDDLGCHFHKVDGVTTVHCEVAKPVEKLYRDLHLLNTNPPEGVRFYSDFLGKAYEVTKDNCADSIVGQALHYFDYTKVIKSAYEDGARFFIEMGPGSTCASMISQILVDRPHAARAVCINGQSEVLNIMRLLAQLNSERLPVDLSSLYIDRTTTDLYSNHQMISVTSGKEALTVNKPEKPVTKNQMPAKPVEKEIKSADIVSFPSAAKQSSPLGDVIEQMATTETAKAGAQETFLRVSNGITDTLSKALNLQMSLLHSRTEDSVSLPDVDLNFESPVTGQETQFSRDMCLEYAIGSISKVLGEKFVAVDSYPTRVRLPDEPLMLVDRILEVEGEACSMSSGRVVTEHDILSGAWYLDSGRIPTCIVVEAGQADLFLSGYLGIDLQTKGLAVYRLLDAEITLHGPLPREGQTIRYDIRIDHFFRQGNAWLFYFNFDGSVDDTSLITMKNGCAGFFSQAELDAGKGIVQTTLETQAMPGKRASDWTYPVAMTREPYSDEQIKALRQGRLADCFGEEFSALELNNPISLPSGRMTLVRRVLDLDPNGGRFGIGQIVGEADIHPDDWFLICHFVDDRVMPGTLMYECCLHTLRIYLLRMGWVAEADSFVYEPIFGVRSKLKCRGQVLDTTKKVQYEITLKEYGYQEDGTPYVIADALMYADGKAIVQMTNMSSQLSGLSKTDIDYLWQNTTNKLPENKRIIFDFDSIYAFATGKPSEAFGDRYLPFDEGRIIARLPGPPYQFLDRIVSIKDCEQWQLSAGGVIEAEYDVPVDAWYFDENRQTKMPFSVLLEVALQPCGWLAAYLGSALTSDIDLFFRNLGGKASQYLDVMPDTGVLHSTIKITNVSQSGGMIIQHYDYLVQSSKGVVYKGNTYFGFFTADALATQIGIREAQSYQATEKEKARNKAFAYPDYSPFPQDMMRMVDQIEVFDPEGGPDGLGFLQGLANVI